MLGKKIRLERIMDRNTRRTVIIPMDHGTTVGPIAGLVQIPPVANLCAIGGANAAVAVAHSGAGSEGACASRWPMRESVMALLFARAAR